MKKCSSLWILSLLVVASLTGNARADDDEPQPDARLQGYQLTGPTEANSAGTVGSLILKDGRGASTWFVLAGVGLVGIGAMFKSGKRSHLD